MNIMKKIIKNYKKLPVFFNWLYDTNSSFIKMVISHLNHPRKINNINFQELYKNVHNDSEPIFILSTWRTWTALLTKILNTIPTIEARHTFELELLHFCKEWFKNNNKDSKYLSAIIDSNRYEYIRNTYLRNIQFIDTSIYATFFARQLSELYPKAKFIHLVRHPGWFINSWIRRKWYMNNSVYEEWYLIPSNKCKKQIEKIAWLWYNTNSFIEDFKDKISNNRVLTVKFEDMVKDTSATNKILNFIWKEKSIHEKQIEKLIKKPVNVQKIWKCKKYKNWSKEDKDTLIPYKKLIEKYWYKL